jgi:hypothetical protein
MINGFSSSRRWILFAAAGGVMGRISALQASPERLPARVDGHSSSLMAKITLPGGTTRDVTLEGVGCPVAMCSRVLIRSNSPGDGNAPGFGLASFWIDTIASIRETTSDGALFVMKDGSQRRLAFVRDFSVLYVVDPSGRAGKLDLAKVDLAKVESLEFLAPPAKK